MNIISSFQIILISVKVKNGSFEWSLRYVTQQTHSKPNNFIPASVAVEIG